MINLQPSHFRGPLGRDTPRNESKKYPYELVAYGDYIYEYYSNGCPSETVEQTKESKHE